MRIGFAGLGAMGTAMAARLLAGGHELWVWNRSPGRDGALLEQGAHAAASPAEIAREAELVFTMLTDDAAVEAVVLGPDGLVDGLGEGTLHVSSSTISVALARRLEEAHARRGQSLVSATVLGRPPAAEAGKLYVMAAGARAAVGRARPALEAFSQAVFEVGSEPWQANLVKLCANFMILSTVEQLSEVFALAAKAGVEEATLFKVLSESFFSAPVHLNYGRLIVERAFSPPGAPMAIGKKDTDLVLAAGEDFGAVLPMASLLRDRFVASLARGDGALDFAALSRRAREDAGLE